MPLVAPAAPVILSPLQLLKMASCPAALPSPWETLFKGQAKGTDL